MLDSAITQLRYAAGVIGGRINPKVLSRVVDDLVATMAEFGAPGEDSALLPGQGGGLDPEIQATVTTRNLRRTARAAAGHTAYYRRLFAECGVDPAKVDLAGWRGIPATPKSALRGMPAAFVRDDAAPGFLATTTGTTGTPAGVWFSARELDIVIAMSTIGMTVTDRVGPGHVIGHATSSRATLPLLVGSAVARRVGAGFVQLGTVEPELAVQRLAAPLGLPGKAAQITHLACSASYLAALVGAAERGRWQRSDFGLELVWTGGEVLSEALAERAAAVLTERASTTYLATEILPAGAATCGQGHLHYPAEFGHFELLDPATLEPARPGSIAALVVTPFVPYRDCTLLLRYVTGDLVRVLEATPDCELATIPATSAILGRYDGPLSLAVTTREILEVLEGEPAVPLPVRYGMVDDPAGPLLHVAVPHAPATVRRRLEDRAARLAPGLAGVVLHADPADVPAAVPLRADLLERSFETVGAVPWSDPVAEEGDGGRGSDLGERGEDPGSAEPVADDGDGDQVTDAGSGDPDPATPLAPRGPGMTDPALELSGGRR